MTVRPFRHCKQHIASIAGRYGDALSPLVVYRAAIAAGHLREDLQQMRALQPLEELHNKLKTFRPPPVPVSPPNAHPDIASDPGKGLWEKMIFMLSRADPPVDDKLKNLEGVPRGVYLFGGVGCGKTLLMDTFFDCAPLQHEEKRRVHFLEFMLEVHQRMHQLRQGHPEMGDPVPQVAFDIASSTKLLCFDEFQVTDVADALVMRRLFHLLFQSGLVMVATSNRPPRQLYQNGIQRESFLPFIDELEQRCHCYDLDSDSDYRMLAQISSGAGMYVHPLNDETRQQVESLFRGLLAGDRTCPQTIRLGGRDVEVPLAGINKKVARFTFDGLCGKPLGAEDYLGIAASFHTVLVEDVPLLTLNDINQVRRFITLVDAFYDNHVKLIISAAVAPEHLFMPEGQGSCQMSSKGARGYVPATQDEVFAFARTLSRLNEMRSHAYLIRAAAGGHLLAREAMPVILFETDSIISEKEANDLFTSYDVDASGLLELPEVHLLLQDLTERRVGHRNVMEAQVQHAFRSMDANDNGEVSRSEFLKWVNTSLANLKLTQTA
uniref:EF-hand domain-containing protein n=2 Tax=Haptolina ericina TaxID=156174 RepID=A0A7S3AUH3_9EUKA